MSRAEKGLLALMWLQCAGAACAVLVYMGQPFTLGWFIAIPLWASFCTAFGAFLIDELVRRGGR